MNTQDNTVPVEVFESARALCEKTQGIFEELAQKRDEIRSVLRQLECGTEFTHTIPGPDKGEYSEIDSNCALPNGHTGEHNWNHATEASPTYLRAVRQDREAYLAAATAQGAWDRACDAVEDLSCGASPRPTEWPCTLRRGHTGTHECPSEMRLVI